jgi:hypothetical protein
MTTDRLAEIKNGSYTTTDVRWLIAQVEKLRYQLNYVETRLRADLIFSPTTDIQSLVDSVIHQRRGAMTELNDVHDILAEALGYQKAPGLEEDPQCPCPGQYVTGDHTAASLALTAAKQLQMANMRHADAKPVEHALDNAVKQIVELQRELAKKPKGKKYARDLEREVERAHRELAARKTVCNCPYQEENRRLMPTPNCPTHGVDALDKKTAGEKALNTLAYVRQYFMGGQ